MYLPGKLGIASCAGIILREGDRNTTKPTCSTRGRGGQQGRSKLRDPARGRKGTPCLGRSPRLKNHHIVLAVRAYKERGVQGANWEPRGKKTSSVHDAEEGEKKQCANGDTAKERKAPSGKKKTYSLVQKAHVRLRERKKKKTATKGACRMTKKNYREKLRPDSLDNDLLRVGLEKRCREGEKGGSKYFHQKKREKEYEETIKERTDNFLERKLA